MRGTIELPEHVRRAAQAAFAEPAPVPTSPPTPVPAPAPVPTSPPVPVPASPPVPASAAAAAAVPGTARTPVYLYDLDGLAGHVTRIRAALTGVEVFYAAKANPDAHVLRTVAPHVDGVEVSSGGELEHVHRTLPRARLAFGGPGKTDRELELALRLSVERIHVESPYELRRLAAIAARLGDARVDVLLRANPEVAVPGAALTMDGPFGMDEAALSECVRLLTSSGEISESIRLRGVHLHLASGLDRPAMLALAERLIALIRRPGSTMAALADAAATSATTASVGRLEINLGGGMGVSYEHPDRRFDWSGYGRGLRALTDSRTTLRIEPGRAVTAYHGWYVTEVLDIKRTRGAWFAVLRGGTHHLRTPVTKGHDQPFAVVPIVRTGSASTMAAPATPDGAAVTLAGQLCTPKDVFARSVPIGGGLAVGDLVVFGMAGAYAWNISHHDFLMHPKPRFRHLGNGEHITG